MGKGEAGNDCGGGGGDGKSPNMFLQTEEAKSKFQQRSREKSHHSDICWADSAQPSPECPQSAGRTAGAVLVLHYKCHYIKVIFAMWIV